MFSRMRRRERLFLSILSLAPIFGCVGNCDSPTPTVEHCGSADETFAVERVEVDAYQSYGGQGLEMIMFNVTYVGDDPPSCAELSYLVSDPTDGAALISGATMVEASETSPGRFRLNTPVWELWPTGHDVVDVQITSHGFTGTDQACRLGTLACAQLDAGDDDAGARDAGP